MTAGFHATRALRRSHRAPAARFCLRAGKRASPRLGVGRSLRTTRERLAQRPPDACPLRRAGVSVEPSPPRQCAAVARAAAHVALAAMRGNNLCREGKPFSYPELRARGEALRRADVRRRPGRLRAGELEVDAGRAWCAYGARRSSCPIRSSRSCARWRRTPPVCSPRISCCARSGAFTRWAVTVARLHIADRARRPNPRRTRRCRYRLAWIGAVPLCGPGVLGPCRQEPLPRAHHVSSRYRCARLA